MGKKATHPIHQVLKRNCATSSENASFLFSIFLLRKTYQEEQRLEFKRKTNVKVDKIKYSRMNNWGLKYQILATFK